MPNVRCVTLTELRWFVSTLAALPGQSALSEMLTENLPIVLLPRGTSMVPPVVLQSLTQPKVPKAR